MIPAEPPAQQSRRDPTQDDKSSTLPVMQVLPLLDRTATPVMLGVLKGSMLGARVLVGARTQVLRLLFSSIIVIIGFEMIYKGITGSL
jgi:uncharacterized membrane protein YfcA